MKFFSKKSKWLSQAEYRSRAELIGKMIWPTTGKKSPGGGNNIIMLDSEDSDGNKLSYEDFNWSLQKLAIILQPFVPHISEEIWSSIGNKTLCINESWPIEEVKKKNTTNIAIQIDGKTKEVIQIGNKISKEEILDIVKNNNKIKKSLMGKNVIREIYVPGKIVNLVIK